jgi:trimethylamine:corrinoid methyltransferase-like protein
MAKLKHLTEYHKKALELKYRGVLYEDIAEKLNEQCQKSGIKRNFTERSLKDWFRNNGPLYETYRLYEEEMDGIHRETLEVIKKAGARVREENFRLANEMLVALMGSENDNVKLGAIKELLDRVEGQPKQFLDIKKSEVGLDLLKHEHRLEKVRGKQAGR